MRTARRSKRSPLSTSRRPTLSSVALVAASDALVLASIATRHACDGYTVVEVPSRPDFWYGHALVLDRQPEPADHARWVARHAEHFRGTNVQKHTIVWSVEGERDRAPLVGPGVGDAILERSVVFARRSPFGGAPDARVRELRDARDWDAAADLSAASDADASIALQVFGRWRFATIHADGMAGRMRMWGAWEGGDLVAFAGLYVSDLVARFVTPVTRVDRRGRGLFRALCGAASDAAMGAYPEASVAIVASAGDAADTIYRRLGFSPIGEQYGLLAERLY